MEAEEEDLWDLAEIFGKVATRTSVLGANGDLGSSTEFDLRSALRVVALTKSLDDSLRRTGGGALIASVRALRVALMTSVANIDRSLGDKYSSSYVFSWSQFLLRGFPASVFAGFDFAEAVAFAVFFEIVGIFEFAACDLGNKRSLRSVAVSGVQVDVELTAAFIDSGVACKEVIIIKEQMGIEN